MGDQYGETRVIEREIGGNCRDGEDNPGHSLRSEVSLKCVGRAVEYVTGSSCEHFVPTDAVVWTESQPRSKVRLGFPSAHVQSHFTDERLGHYHIDAIDARQIHSGDALQLLGKMEVRIILVLFLLLFRG